MKLTKILLTTSVMLSGSAYSLAQQTDPSLTAAVGAQTLAYEEIHKKRSKLQEQIIAAEATVTLALDRVHAVENKMLSYLSNAQGAVANLYQIKRAAELVAIDIPDKISLLNNSVKGNLQGTFIAAIVSSKVNDVYEQMLSLFPFVSQLVTSGTYDVPNGSGGNDKHKVNLLNSAERYYIANEIVWRLERINTDLLILAYQVRSMTFNDLWLHLDPKSWAIVMNGKNIANQVISDWKRATK